MEFLKEERMNELETRLVDVDTIQPHPRNANEGDVGAISESLKIHGQYRAIVVSARTGNIVAGNHTYLAAVSLGWTQIVAHFLDDLTDEDEVRLMLADNQYARLATYDTFSLAELLTELADTDLALAGTGFDGDALDEMLDDLDTSSFLPASEDEQGQLDTVGGSTRIECPECGHTFMWSERANSGR